MVKIVDKDPKEIEYEERTNRLIALTRNVLPENYRVGTFSDTLFLVYAQDAAFDSMLCIHTVSNKIRINHPSSLETAIELARAYEKVGEPEFTVKKDYRQS